MWLHCTLSELWRLLELLTTTVLEHTNTSLGSLENGTFLVRTRVPLIEPLIAPDEQVRALHGFHLHQCVSKCLKVAYIVKRYIDAVHLPLWSGWEKKSVW